MNLKGGWVPDHRRMIVKLDTQRLQTPDQVREFLAGSRPLDEQDGIALVAALHRPPGELVADDRLGVFAAELHRGLSAGRPETRPVPERPERRLAGLPQDGRARHLGERRELGAARDLPFDPPAGEGERRIGSVRRHHKRGRTAPQAVREGAQRERRLSALSGAPKHREPVVEGVEDGALPAVEPQGLAAAGSARGRAGPFDPVRRRFVQVDRRRRRRSWPAGARVDLAAESSPPTPLPLRREPPFPVDLPLRHRSIICHARYGLSR